MSQQQRYRPDIDGLRAIAVLLVVGFHMFPTAVPGGYVGVDVFFVISGFLITGLLLQDLENQQFSFLGFYGRRIRRIFPALIAVLATSCIAGWLLLPPREFKSLGLNIFGSAGLSPNLVLLGETSYFDIAPAEKPLLHLWSLGIEEQFYLVWPILLLFAFSRRISVLILALALFSASFALNIKELGTAAAFYLPLTRAWELMLGGMMAAYAIRGDRFGLDRLAASIRPPAAWKMPQRLVSFLSPPDWRALIGLALILFAVAGLSSRSAFPGWWALLPTLGTVLVVSADGAWLNRKLLSHRAAVLIGLISYPLYLWHWPLLSFATVLDPLSSRLSRIALIFAAIAAAWATYRWIELPIRTGGRRQLKVAWLCIAMTVVGAAGVAVLFAQGLPERIPPEIRAIANIKIEPAFERTGWRLHSCFLQADDPPGHFASDCIERGRRPLLWLWGDSFAAALSVGLKELQHSYDFALAQFATAACPPFYALSVPESPSCADNNAHVLAALSDVHPDIVVLYSSWQSSFGNFLPNLAKLVVRLRELKIPRIIIMGPPPAWDDGLPNATFRYYMKSRALIPTRSDFHVNKFWYAYQRQFRHQVLPLGTEYISAWDAMCDGDRCLTRVGDTAADLVAFDQYHATLAGSIAMARAIAPCLFPDHDDTAALAAAVCTRPEAGKSAARQTVPVTR